MNIVILAAGKGSRLGLAIPKAMVEVEAGTTILDLQVQNLIRQIPLQDISIVVGFMKEKVQASAFLSYVELLKVLGGISQ